MKLKRQAKPGLSSAMIDATAGSFGSTEASVMLANPLQASLANLQHHKGRVGAVFSVLMCFLGILSPTAHANSYTINFPNDELLISEGGHWITAGTPGVNWHNTMAGFRGDEHVSSVSTAPGYAFGPTGPKRFGDALALLTGTWSPDQMAEATVRQVNPIGYPEVEIRLRTSAKDATGYEIMWSALGKNGSPYVAIATWNGPASAPPHWTFLKELHGKDYGVATGDVVKGMIVGNTITAYKNGKQQFQITDNTFSQGNPGFGFNEGPSGTYGISSFTASDVVPQTMGTASSYSTNFPSAERLISEGVTSGATWHDIMAGFKGDEHVSSVSTTPGYAFDSTGPKRSGDALTLLTESWNPDQMAEAAFLQVSPFGYP